MALQLTLDYPQLLMLVEQLDEAQQQALLVHLLNKSSSPVLSSQERKALYRASILTHSVNKAPSMRREDWYGDDGR